MKKISLYTVVLLLIIALQSCSKPNDEKISGVRIFGNNGFDEPVMLYVDTVLLRDTYTNEPQIIEPSMFISAEGMAYRYRMEEPEKKITLVGANSGNTLLEVPLPKGVLRQRIGLAIADGKNTFNPPAPSPDTNKVGFFIADPFFKVPVDIVMSTEIRNMEGQVVDSAKQILIKGLKPFQWVYVDYVPTGVFADPNCQSIYLNFYESGTDIGAFGQDPRYSAYVVSAYDQNGNKENIVFPVRNQRGRVCSFMVTVYKTDASPDPGTYPKAVAW